MARPRIQVPEEMQDLVWELKDQGYKLKQIALRTGLKYHIVQRLLSQPRAGITTVPIHERITPQSTSATEVDNVKFAQSLRQQFLSLKEGGRALILRADN